MCLFPLIPAPPPRWFSIKGTIFPLSLSSPGVRGSQARPPSLSAPSLTLAQGRQSDFYEYFYLCSFSQFPLSYNLCKFKTATLDPFTFTFLWYRSSLSAVFPAFLTLLNAVLLIT